MESNGIIFILVMALAVAGCSSSQQKTNQNEIAYDPKIFSRSVCLMEEPKEAGWQEVSNVQSELGQLRAKILKPAMLIIPDPTEIWYEAPNRLLMCSTSGASLCGHTTYKFKYEANEWKEDGGVLVMCEPRRK